MTLAIPWLEKGARPSPGSGAETTIRALYEAIELANFDALGEYFQEQAIYRRPGCSAIAGRGRIVDYYRRVRAIATSRIIVDTVITQSAHAVACGLVEGRGRTASLSTRSSQISLFSNTGWCSRGRRISSGTASDRDRAVSL